MNEPTAQDRLTASLDAWRDRRHDAPTSVFAAALVDLLADVVAERLKGAVAKVRAKRKARKAAK